jgi:serine/threonine protein kinase
MPNCYTVDMRQYLNYIAASNQGRHNGRVATQMAQQDRTATGPQTTTSLGGLAEQQVQFVVAQLILAIGYCHSRGIIHRDVKPENILINRRGYLSLTDYGIAKEPAPDIDSCRSTSGTHGYMAPEIYANKHVHGRPADW